MSIIGGHEGDEFSSVHRSPSAYRQPCDRAGTPWGSKISPTATKNLPYPQSTGPMYLYYLDLNQLGEVVTP
jgi:hypothetical protein